MTELTWKQILERVGLNERQADASMRLARLFGPRSVQITPPVRRPEPDDQGGER